MRILQRTIVIVLLGLTATPGSAAEAIGRLFMTPEQRAALDSARESGTDLLTAAGQPTSSPAASPDEPVVLNGVVRRSRGPDVTWVNGTRVSTSGPEGVYLRRGPDRHNQVTLEEAGGARARLKPGQFWIPATGQVADCYGCAVIRKPADPIETPPATTTEPAAAAPPTASPAAPRATPP